MVATNLPPRDDRPGLHCDESTLLSLLDETLSAQQQSAAEDHLSRCRSCQKRLETLVGDSTLWSETRSVYAEKDLTLGDSRFEYDGAAASASESNVTIAWLRAVSQPAESADPNCLGRIDRYRIDSVIGSGGMGVVVAGFDDQLGRPVAIKLLAPHLAGLAAARRRFAREARAAAAIVHPAIMPIYGVSEKSHPPYLVMPMVGSSSTGRSLQDRIDDDGPLDLETSLGIAAQIAEGLTAAHARGVVHRDIKPGNILLEENSPRVLISDFGLARAIDDATVTVSGMVAGTPQYMSPEQASGDEVGPKTDLFSLGSVLYAMLTGRAPFTADSPIAVLRKVIDIPAKPVSGRVETLPPWVDHLVEQFMAKDPAERITSAGRASALLRSVEAHVRNPSANDLPNQLRPRQTKMPLLAMALVTVLVMVGIAATQFPWSASSAASSAESSKGITSHLTSTVENQTEHSTQTTPGDAKTRSVASDNVAVETDMSWQWNGFNQEVQRLHLQLESLEQVD